jgi:hypothetical protein
MRYHALIVFRLDDGGCMAHNDATEPDWKIATEYYPDLITLDVYLRTLSDEVASNFRTRIIKSKAFDERHDLALQMEADFLAAEFGRNKEIVDFGRQLIQNGHRQASTDLHHTVAVLGDEFDSDIIIARIRHKYPDIQVEGHSAYYSVTGNLRNSDPQASPGDIAKRLSRTQLIDDAEELILSLGGKIVKRQLASGHSVFILKLTERYEAFNTQSDKMGH